MELQRVFSTTNIHLHIASPSTWRIKATNRASGAASPLAIIATSRSLVRSTATGRQAHQPCRPRHKAQATRAAVFLAALVVVVVEARSSAVELLLVERRREVVAAVGFSAETTRTRAEAAHHNPLRTCLAAASISARARLPLVNPRRAFLAITSPQDQGWEVDWEVEVICLAEDRLPQRRRRQAEQHHQRHQQAESLERVWVRTRARQHNPADPACSAV